MPVRSFTAKLAAASAISAIIFTAFPSVAAAQSAGTRQLMERCVDNVLARMARAKVPEAQVGPAVVSHCDGPLHESGFGHRERASLHLHSRKLHRHGPPARRREGQKAYRERLGGGL